MAKDPAYQGRAVHVSTPDVVAGAGGGGGGDGHEGKGGGLQSGHLQPVGQSPPGNCPCQLTSGPSAEIHTSLNVKN